MFSLANKRLSICNFQMKELKKFPEKGLTSSPNSAPFNRPNPKWHRAYEYKNPGMNDVDIN